MERRYEARLEEMLEDAEVTPELLMDRLPRLETFVQPVAAARDEPAQRRHAAEDMAGLLSNLEHQTGEAIAYLHDQERQGIQKFIGHGPWDHRPVLATVVDQVGEPLGEPDAVLVFDPSGVPKTGAKSVGVARQGCGRLGTVDHCQVGISMAYVSRTEHPIVNTRLDLPEEWAQDRGRRKEAGIPAMIKFQTRHELALEMLKECGGRLPHAWVTGDDEMGRPSGFRQKLRAAHERDLLAVPSNLRIGDIEVAPPESSGRGRHPRVPFAWLEDWWGAVPEAAWTRIDVRDGENGPLVIESVTRRIQARTETGGTGPEELLFRTRERQNANTDKHDSYFSTADPGPSRTELAWVAKAEHRIEQCLERAKGEAGLADDQVRTWIAWHHHQTLALRAAWFLTEETRRGNNPDPGADVAAPSAAHRGADRASPQHQSSVVAVSP